MEICTFGISKRIRFAAEYLSGGGVDLPYRRVVLLPVPTTKDKKFITGTECRLEEILPMSEAGALVVGYALPDWLCGAISERGAEIFDLALDEEFLVENAELTAHGTLGRLLLSEPRGIRGRKVGIVGYGRIGKALARLLLFLRADVTVFSSRPEVVIELCRSGVSAELSSADTEPFGLDILINTAPSPLPFEEKLVKIPRIIELASGKNLPELPTVERYPSIPEELYPGAAGEAIARRILKKMA